MAQQVEERQGFYLVHHKELRSNRNTGEAYLSLSLGNRDGVFDARVWDNLDKLPPFVTGQVVHVRAHEHTHRNRTQLAVRELRVAENGEASLQDLLPHSKRPPEEMFAELSALVDTVADAHLRPLLRAVLDDPEIGPRFRRAPAAKTMHHAWIGGLLEHVLSLAQLADRAAAHYPEIRRDLLLAGAVLHDIGKVYELSYEGPFHYTNEGHLLGHLVQGLAMVREKIRGLPGFPPRLATLVGHMILSHHGQQEFGSPKTPMFPEAVLLHYLDDLDSKMAAMRASLETPGDGEWTARNASLERMLLRVDRFLGEKKPQ
jgi:3'-5' exoribonuclease